MEMIIPGLALLGLTLLLCGLKGHWGPSRFLFKPFAIIVFGTCILVLIGEKVGPWAGFIWAALGLCLYVLGCCAIALLMIFRTPKVLVPRLGRPLRAACVSLGGVLILLSPLIYMQTDIAVWLCKRAVAEGSTSPLAATLDPRLRPWNSLGQLPPSPQREQLVQEVYKYGPYESFWKILLSLPPSPERLEVIKTFSRDALIISAEWMFITLYDQGDVAGQDALLDADYKLSAFEGSIVLKHIVNAGRMDILRQTLQHPKAYFSESAVHAAIDTNNLEMLVVLLDSRKDTGKFYRNPLRRAVERGRKDLIGPLRERGFDLNGDCALEVAVAQPDMVAFLLEQGASSACKDKALYAAVRAPGHMSTIELLLQGGADMNARDSMGRSPLWTAASAGYIEAFNRLLAGGADISLTDKDGDTILHEVTRSLSSISAPHARHDIMTRIMLLQPELATVPNANGKTPVDYVHDAQSLTILRGEASPDSLSSPPASNSTPPIKSF